MHQYNVALKWNEGRLGEISSPELKNKIEIATPPQFPKGVEGVWSPEHLFTAAVNACYMTTFLSIAENSKLDFKSFTCDALGDLDLIDSKYQITKITLNPTLTISNITDKEKALRILEKTEKACLISNSIKSAVVLNPTIIC